MATEAELQFYIQHGQEERYLEYKRAMIWKGNALTKIKIAKAMMAMSNIKNGGVIVVGMQEITKNSWESESLTEDQLESFNHDDIAAWVNGYATPAVQFSVQSCELEGNKFVIIQVREFTQSPVVCRKAKVSGGEELKEGAVYYRSNGKVESAPISTEEDMRELLKLGVDKGVAGEIDRLRELKLIPTIAASDEDDFSKFEEERAGL